jgi:hypothetical protein
MRSAVAAYPVWVVPLLVLLIVVVVAVITTVAIMRQNAGPSAVRVVITDGPKVLSTQVVPLR